MVYFPKSLSSDWNLFAECHKNLYYTAAHGNPHTYLDIYFFTNEFILQIHTMTFLKYYHQYFTDPSCDFMQTHVRKGI